MIGSPGAMEPGRWWQRGSEWGGGALGGGQVGLGDIEVLVRSRLVLSCAIPLNGTFSRSSSPG